METITKNGKEYLRFKIGDFFDHLPGEAIEFSKLLNKSKTSIDFDSDKGYIHPCYSGATKGNHVVGYSTKYNFDGKGIKVSGVGAGAGKCFFIDGKARILKNCYILKNNICNEFFSIYLEKKLKKFTQKTTMPSLQYGYIKDEYIEIPTNHQELSKVIARVLEYKQLSKQLSKQFKDYKQAILQEANKAIEIHKQNGDHDKYISFKIGDEFKAISGKGSFNKMKKEGLASDHYDEEKGFVYPVYSASSIDNHICGFSIEKNNQGIWVENEFIKTTTSGDPGKSVFVNSNKSLLCEKAYALKSKISNNYIALLFDKEIPFFSQGSAQRNAYFNNYKDESISLPLSHNLLANKIKQINHWETIVNQTTKQMETYIDGVLQLSLKGATNE